MEIFRLFGRILVDNDEANQSIAATGQEAETSGGKLDKLGGFAKNLGGILGGALLAGATAAAGGFVALAKVGGDVQNALGNLQAKTGASKEEMEGLNETLKNIYAAGYGESFDDISNAMALVMQNTSATGDELENMTKVALGLSETFDFDINESTRTAEMLMKQFGISSEQAFNLMVQGTQKGANKNGDLLDTLNEYSPLFSSIGLDAEWMMDILVSGAENG